MVCLRENSIDSPGLDALAWRAAIGKRHVLNNTITNVPAGPSAIIDNSSPATFSWCKGTSASAYNSANSVATRFRTKAERMWITHQRLLDRIKQHQSHRHDLLSSQRWPV